MYDIKKDLYIKTFTIFSKIVFKKRLLYLCKI